jgi:hypothetical protein
LISSNLSAATTAADLGLLAAADVFKVGDFDEAPNEGILDDDPLFGNFDETLGDLEAILGANLRGAVTVSWDLLSIELIANFGGKFKR